MTIRNILDKIKNTLSKGDQRSARAKKNIVLTILIKGLGILIGFIYFPLSLDYLGTVKFGIYLTLLSIVDWFLNFDVGIGLGLRNKFAESLAEENHHKAKSYVSTAYFALGGIILLLMTVLILLNFSLPWTDWIQIDSSLTEEVKLLGTIIIIAFGIRFIARNIYEIFYATQRMAYVEYFTFLTKFSFLILILILPFIQPDSLLLFGSAKALTFALVPLSVGLFYFQRKFRQYKPSIGLVRKDYFGDLFSLGVKFFLIKISLLVINKTNNILIASFVSLEGVPQYEAAYKYLSIFLIVFVIINNQLWPSNTEAYIKGDIKWMKSSLKAVLKVWIISLFIVAIMVVLAPWVYSMWLGEQLNIPTPVSIAVAASVCLATWINIFSIILNGTGKIRLQMYAYLFAALSNIPISIFFVKILDYGVVGIILGTVVSLIPLAVLAPIQVQKILTGRDSGLWAK